MNRNYVKFFYSTDSRGRIRVPKQLMDAMGVQPKDKLFVSSGRISADKTKGSRRITADKYNNLLFKVSEKSGEEFRFRLNSKNNTVVFDVR